MPRDHTRPGLWCCRLELARPSGASHPNLSPGVGLLRLSGSGSLRKASQCAERATLRAPLAGTKSPFLTASLYLNADCDTEHSLLVADG